MHRILYGNGEEPAVAANDEGGAGKGSNGVAVCSFCALASSLPLAAVVTALAAVAGYYSYAAGVANFETPPVWTPLLYASLMKSMTLRRNLLTTTFYTDSPEAMTTTELKGERWCSFKTRTGLPMNCQEDNVEHEIVSTYVRPNSTVLEIGAKHGTVTCEIAKVQTNSGRLVAAEADEEMWSVLHHNQVTHRCSFTILLGAVSKTEFVMTRTMTGQRYIRPKTATDDGGKEAGKKARVIEEAKQVKGDVAATTDDSRAIFTLPLPVLERTTGFRFDTVVIHCDGCAEHFLHDNFGFLDRIGTIVIEGDDDVSSADTCDKSEGCAALRDWLDRLQRNKGYRLEQVVREQSYNHLVQYLPEKVMHHYILVRY